MLTDVDVFDVQQLAFLVEEPPEEVTWAHRRYADLTVIEPPDEMALREQVEIEATAARLSPKAGDGPLPGTRVAA